MRGKVDPVRFKNFDWFVENHEEISAKYSDKWIAISNDEVVAVADSAEELIPRVKAIGREKALFVHVSPEAWGGYN